MYPNRPIILIAKNFNGKKFFLTINFISGIIIKIKKGVLFYMFTFELSNLALALLALLFYNIEIICAT